MDSTLRNAVESIPAGAIDLENVEDLPALFNLLGVDHEDQVPLLENEHLVDHCIEVIEDMGEDEEVIDYDKEIKDKMSIPPKKKPNYITNDMSSSILTSATPVESMATTTSHLWWLTS